MCLILLTSLCVCVPYWLYFHTNLCFPVYIVCYEHLLKRYICINVREYPGVLRTSVIFWGHSLSFFYYVINQYYKVSAMHLNWKAKHHSTYNNVTSDMKSRYDITQRDNMRWNAVAADNQEVYVLILFIYIIRVSWGNHISPYFTLSNGVKQGGVLSPNRFTYYIDNLLVKLE